MLGTLGINEREPAGLWFGNHRPADCYDFVTSHRVLRHLCDRPPQTIGPEPSSDGYQDRNVGEREMTTSTTYTPPITEQQLEQIANRTIADLVEHAPGTMTVFSAYGLDMCCGGGLPLGEALTRHGIEVEPVVRQVATIMSESQDW